MLDLLFCEFSGLPLAGSTLSKNIVNIYKTDIYKKYINICIYLYVVPKILKVRQKTLLGLIFSEGTPYYGQSLAATCISAYNS